jgi:hypothetical protein
MWSGVDTGTFLKRTVIINLGEADGLALARGEGLEAHARSIAVRLG